MPHSRWRSFRSAPRDRSGTWRTQSAWRRPGRPGLPSSKSASAAGHPRPSGPVINTLAEKGPEKLLDTLRDLPRAGFIRTPGNIGYDLRFARKTPLEEGGEQIVIVTDRPIGIWEAVNRPRTIEYPFTLIELRLDNKGNGEGKISLATKIVYDKRRKTIVLENYSSAPVMLTKVRTGGRQAVRDGALSSTDRADACPVIFSAFPSTYPSEASMNVLLFSMPDSFEHTPSLTMRMPNGALASLAGNVDPHHDVAVADLILAQKSVPETVTRLVASHQPDIVGLSVMTFQRKTALKVIALVRSLRPRAAIVVGGYDPSLAPEHYEDPGSGVDFIVSGEGDLTFRELVRSLEPAASHLTSVLAGTPPRSLALRRSRTRYPRFMTPGPHPRRPS